jgi:hypothetical protein
MSQIAFPVFWTLGYRFLCSKILNIRNPFPNLWNSVTTEQACESAFNWALTKGVFIPLICNFSERIFKNPVWLSYSLSVSNEHTAKGSILWREGIFGFLYGREYCGNCFRTAEAFLAGAPLDGGRWVYGRRAEISLLIKLEQQCYRWITGPGCLLVPYRPAVKPIKLTIVTLGYFCLFNVICYLFSLLVYPFRGVPLSFRGCFVYYML